MGHHNKWLHSKMSLSVTSQGDLPDYYSGHCSFKVESLAHTPTSNLKRASVSL